MVSVLYAGRMMKRVSASQPSQLYGQLYRLEQFLWVKIPQLFFLTCNFISFKLIHHNYHTLLSGQGLWHSSLFFHVVLPPSSWSL
jgi:hypothetical protein